MTNVSDATADCLLP